MRTLTGMSKDNSVASRKHMKKCQFWKMSSLKGKSKCQRDRYFTHREHCLLGAALKDVRIIFFFPCWNELQLPGIKHTKHGSDTPIAWRGVWSLLATLFRESHCRKCIHVVSLSEGKEALECVLICNMLESAQSVVSIRAAIVHQVLWH